jgi:hypothetical protein
VAGSWENNNEPSDSIKYWNILKKLIGWCHLKKGSASQTWLYEAALPLEQLLLENGCMQHTLYFVPHIFS